MAPYRRIYVDLDDVLSLTIEPLAALLEALHGRRVAVEDVRHFDLGRSFGLDEVELDDFMRRAHEPGHLAALAPAPGAAEALGRWSRRGYRVEVMTGRPPSSAPISRDWLARHEIPHAQLACVDKYAREDWHAADEPALAFAEVGARGFALAVEDSLEVAVELASRWRIPVALMDRPWNRELPALPAGVGERLIRCRSWSEVAARFPAP
jgi:uncharacterized HAD superfamily protein